MAFNQMPQQVQDLHDQQPHSVPEYAGQQPQVVTAEQAQHIDPNLPPAGYRREDELARRQLALEATKEIMGQTSNVEAVGNPNMLDHKKNADNEILRHYQRDPFTGGDEILIDGLQRDRYAYKLVNHVNPTTAAGTHVWAAKRQGWETIPQRTPSGEYIPDGCNLPREAYWNSPYIGDTILMRMPVARFNELEGLKASHIARQHAQRSHAPLESNEYSVGHGDINKDPYLGQIFRGQSQAVPMPGVPTQARMAHVQAEQAPPADPYGQTIQNAAAQQMAFQGLTDDLRTGTVQGMEFRQ